VFAGCSGVARVSELAVAKKAVLVLLLLSLMASCVLQIHPGKAVPQTLFVPDDYPTLTAAVGNATEGDTVFVRMGIYEEETLEINKALSIIGQDVKNTVVNFHPPLVTSTIFTQTFTSYANPIDIKADDVKLSSLTINSEGGEISATGNRTQITGNILNISVHLLGSYQTVSKNNLTAGVTCSVGSYGSVYKNNVVNGSIGCDSGSHNRFFANQVSGGSISSDGTSTDNLIYGNTVKNGGGIWACYGDVVAKNTVTDSELGISISWGFNNTICGNIITNNRGAGLTKLEGANNTFYANYVANNSVGVEIGVYSSLQPLNTTFYHNDFAQNIQQTKVIGLDHSDCWDNGEEGNFWSNYTGSDANQDGLGDSPHVIFGERHPYDEPGKTYIESYEDRYPLMTPFNCSNILIELPEWATNLLPSLLASTDTTPPTISILSVENASYPLGNLSLTFTASEPTSWIGYSLDEQENITVAGNTVLTGLFVGSHHLTVYANDTAGNTGASDTIHFRIETSFPTTLVVAVAITACVFGFGLIINIIAGKRKSTESQNKKF
jgi:nitrous oxidase accessory protein